MPFESAGRPDKPVFSSSKETSSIIVEKKDEITASLGASGSSRMIDGSSRSLHDAADAGVVESTDVIAASAGTDAIKMNAVVNTAHVVCLCLSRFIFVLCITACCMHA